MRSSQKNTSRNWPDKAKSMEITLTKNELYSMIKKAVRDVIQEERLDLILKNVPHVSDDEQKDIEELYGKKPPKRKAARRVTLNL